MKFEVVHETIYHYAPAARTALHMAHLQPRHTEFQRLIQHRLDIAPHPLCQKETTDRFGNVRTFFCVPNYHDRLQVTARSVVATRKRAAPPPGMAWEAVREQMRYRRGARYEPAVEFVFASPYVPKDPRFVHYAAETFLPDRPILEASFELMRRIHCDFTYEPQATTAHTVALEALRLRKGVCQDLAHVMLGCLRSLGLPARYVSGYLLTHPPQGQPRLIGADASHAWVSVYAPGGQNGSNWVDLDPTNAQMTTADYITSAIGRDYSDVSPVRGVIHGGNSHSLSVAVTVTPMAGCGDDRSKDDLDDVC